MLLIMAIFAPYWNLQEHRIAEAILILLILYINEIGKNVHQLGNTIPVWKENNQFCLQILYFQ
jgi:hypothetical protein